MYYSPSHFNKNSSFTLTNNEIETYYYRLLNDVIRNEVNLSKISSSLNYLKNNIDCTVYIEVEKTQKVKF
jgi:hypothetical protein